MYQCLVNYTGAVPAEFYSIKKRPVKIQNNCTGAVPAEITITLDTSVIYIHPPV